MENKLLFNENQSYAWIEFENGKESLEFNYKEEAIKAILDCFKQNKISKAEVITFINEVIKTKNFKWKIVESIESMGGLLIEIPETITNPYFKLCKCDRDGVYGYFYNGDGEKISHPIKSKIEGEEWIEFFSEHDMLTEVMCITIKADLDKSKLPKEEFNPKMN